MGQNERVVILIDMDCFYCQVEEKLDPELKDKPIAVVQYNAWRGGGIIAVNYPARDEGVTRHMRGNEAKQKCPSIQLVSVPAVRGKADLTKYRDAGKEVADVLATFTPLLERASVDEAYLDITEVVEQRISSDLKDLTIDNLSNTFVVGSELKDYIHNAITNEFCADKLKLAVGGLICEEIRTEVFRKTGYKCSAGIARNKVLAKLVCSLHKPNKQTILPQDAVEEFFETIPINKVKNLGGKFGQRVSDDFHIVYMGQLAKIPEKELLQKYDEKTVNWLCNVAKGVDTEPVTTKLLSKSIACCKNFPGITALTTSENVEHWLRKLAEEMEERLEKDLKENNRKAKQIIISFTQETNRKDVHSSRTHSLTSYNSQKIARATFEVIKKNCMRSDESYHVKFLGISASHFEDIKNVREITTFFQAGQSKSDGKKTTKQNSFKTRGYDGENHDIKNYDTAGQSFHCGVAQEVEHYRGMGYRNNSCADESGDNSAANQSNIDINLDLLEGNDNNSPKSSVSELSKPASFFAKYFVKDPSSNIPENDKFQSTENENVSVEMESDYPEMFVENNPGEICGECQKFIPMTDLMSHQDYHFALKLSRGETVCQKPENKSVISGRKRGRSKCKKEKTDANNALTMFLKKEEEDSTAVTEICPECNKKIKIEEISSHMDYHAAKKIHLEINAIKTVKPTSTSHVKYKKGKSQTSNRSVTSFFRPT